MEFAEQSEPEVLVVADAAAWREWLDDHEGVSDGIWLRLAKKGVVTPTSLTYAEALEEALCSGWIDGQRKSHDETTFRQRFTPRRARSMWSKRNVDHVARLLEQGRMRARGLSEVEAAEGDGRWDRAYAGAASAAVPDDLVAALEARAGAWQRFTALGGQERYAILHQLMTAPNDQTRARRLERFVEQLSDSEQG
ncbi:YdeI/OmpD-associated family protein [Saxibacter everestensis]|uniref:YdeI/OmpD-associated family protein n=1 Tax=Saxibacter everestensis TaxID=2909229 RepID=A0ABY8QS10_9MICO|nr:YdeI/OmpD-associated family protein [Brevibacteriaceae bacterium ZFBP1038]